MFLARYSYSSLATMCRAIRHGHGAGLTLVKVFELQARSGPQELRGVTATIAQRLRAGDTLSDALKEHGDRFPELFLTMAVVGDETGHLPEVFGQLEEYFRLQERMRRDFIAQATWPVLQFIGGVLVIAFTIFLMGFIAEGRGNEPIAPIGFGLTGASGALLFLVVVVGGVVALLLGYKAFTSTLQKQAAFEAWVLKWPIIGPCIQALAMGRFCLALRLTLDSSMPVAKALRQSLRATGNAAFMAQVDPIVKRVSKGEELATAIGLNPIFPNEFLGILSVAEIAGHIPESMAQQAEYYREEMVIRSKRLTRALSVGIYIMVAIFLIFMIFRIAMLYSNALNG